MGKPARSFAVTFHLTTHRMGYINIYGAACATRRRREREREKAFWWSARTDGGKKDEGREVRETGAISFGLISVNDEIHS